MFRAFSTVMTGCRIILFRYCTISLNGRSLYYLWPGSRCLLGTWVHLLTLVHCRSSPNSLLRKLMAPISQHMFHNLDIEFRYKKHRRIRKCISPSHSPSWAIRPPPHLLRQTIPMQANSTSQWSINSPNHDKNGTTNLGIHSFTDNLPHLISRYC